jgi:hypothetical protein
MISDVLLSSTESAIILLKSSIVGNELKRRAALAGFYNKLQLELEVVVLSPKSPNVSIVGLYSLDRLRVICNQGHPIGN